MKLKQKQDKLTKASIFCNNVVVYAEAVAVSGIDQGTTPPWPEFRNARWPIPGAVNVPVGYFWPSEET
jgi:hypothetical protein